MRIVGAFNRYMGSDSDGFLGAITGGSRLCVLALLGWFFPGGVDVCDNMDFVSALLSCQIVDSAKCDPGGHMRSPRWAVSISAPVLLLVVVPRLAVSFALFITGARFLCYTSEIADLILNAVALGFIMGMDEEFFAFLPVLQCGCDGGAIFQLSRFVPVS